LRSGGEARWRSGLVRPENPAVAPVDASEVAGSIGKSQRQDHYARGASPAAARACSGSAYTTVSTMSPPRKVQTSPTRWSIRRPLCFASSLSDHGHYSVRNLKQVLEVPVVIVPGGDPGVHMRRDLWPLAGSHLPVSAGGHPTRYREKTERSHLPCRRRGTPAATASSRRGSDAT
jgi:hypothetical protein